MNRCTYKSIKAVTSSEPLVPYDLPDAFNPKQFTNKLIAAKGCGLIALLRSKMVIMHAVIPDTDLTIQHNSKLKQSTPFNTQI